jgi:Spy/CpxP family protein refolding chaperone
MTYTVENKLVAKPCLLVLSGLFCLATPASSLDVPSGKLSATKSLAPNASSSIAPSLTAHLQLQSRQVLQLDRLYDDYATRRIGQEKRLIQWQQELGQTQAPGSLDERKANRLLRNISDAEQKVASDLLSTRAKALKTLTPVQRAELENWTSDAKPEVRHDRYYQLFLLPVEELWQSTLDTSNRPNLSVSTPQYQRPRRKGTGHYGVYGGYGYGGAQYGVYGGYGKGPVGVHAGIGRGGPSVGISIGGVFVGR